MAQFEGTINEFMKYVGAYARIKVMQIASKYKRSLGRCQECGLETQYLDAAHIKGKERPLIISNILSQFIEGDKIYIDLNEFEERFIEAHLPIESTIRILCKPCHRKYDSSTSVDVIEPEVTDVKDSLDTNVLEKNEIQIIQKLITEQKMNKAKAIELARTKSLTTLSHSNTIFSNINAAKDVWWLEPDNNKFASNLNIILNNDRVQTIYIFKLPANTIRNPAQYFIQRNDDVKVNCSKIYIPVSGIKFSDKEFDFTPYLIEKIEY
jgi:hypothetical protein